MEREIRKTHMKFYHMTESTEKEYDENGNEIIIHLDEGEVSAETMKEYVDMYRKYVDYGVIFIDRIDTETNTIYFYSDVV